MTQYMESAELEGWNMVQAAAQAMATFDHSRPARFARTAANGLRPLAPQDPNAALLWDPFHGWSLPAGASRQDVLELYLPIGSATAGRPITLGHIGQSLDGFIATPTGDSCSVTGPDNILHLHRLRALCDAVVVGAGTVAADNPRLTTRLVSGSNPVRVILDPSCRLPATHTVFRDGEAPTIRVCAIGAAGAAAALTRGEQVLEVAACGRRLDLKDVLAQLHARGHCRIFVEGGGITVSSFLEAGLLDRLHVAVAPLLIGEGRPAIRLSPQLRLQDCLRLRYRVFRCGQDFLYDCDLRAVAGGTGNGGGNGAYATVQRVL
jgi:riboflavin-specific deaminase-like protein